MATMNLSSKVTYKSDASPNPIVYNFNSDIEYNTVLSGTVEIPAKAQAGFILRIPSENSLTRSEEVFFDAQCLGLILVNRNASDIQLLLGSGMSPIYIDEGGGGVIPDPKGGGSVILNPGGGVGIKSETNLQLAANGVLMLTNPKDVKDFRTSIGDPFVIGVTTADQKVTPGYVDFWFFNNKAVIPRK